MASFRQTVLPIVLIIIFCLAGLSIFGPQLTSYTMPTAEPEVSSSPPPLLSPPPPPPPQPLPSVRDIYQRLRPAVKPPRVSAHAAARSDPRRVPWGVNVTLHGRPPAIVLFAPHKTASTFFTTLLHDLARLLGLCWYGDNVAFTYAPTDHAKCATPSCGHGKAEAVPQRSFEPSDGGWGDCAAFASTQIVAASSCAQQHNGYSTLWGGDGRAREDGASAARAIGDELPMGRADASESSDACTPLPLSAQNGVAWGAVRLPPAMHRVLRALGTPPWHWYLVLHQRHPGDTLVSEYHSFGWSHPPPPKATAEQRARHLERQARIRNTSVADYVASHLPDLRRKYVPYLEMLRHAPPGDTRTVWADGHTDAGALPASKGNVAPAAPVTIVRSRYEELVTDFGQWLEPLMTALQPSYTPQTLAMLREALRARHAHSFEADGRHRRSVTPGKYAAEVSELAAAAHRREHKEWWAPLGY